MKPSQIFSILAMFTAFSIGLSLIWENYVWASKGAGVWILLYYTWLITSEYEDKE